uniref:type II toxin-antitoxin system RelB family antitoxin n=1 Tax=Sulfuriferula sp. GW6 TaxID=3345112 RepID=UPI0039F6A686
MNTETIDHTTLSRLAEAGAVRSAHIVGQKGGWGVLVKYGMTERALAAQRSHQVRIFRKFETLVSYLKGVGIARFEVDAVDYDPTLKATRARPDRAVAMKNAHEAAAYDKWFRAQVQEALDDPRPSIPHEQVQAEWAIERAELLKRAGQAR